jgi:dTDP-4-dehydrorhamnose reductase
MKKILVLGMSGMLGSMIYDYLKKNPSIEVAGTYLKKEEIEAFVSEKNLFHFDASKKIKDQLHQIYQQFNADYIINCIGIIKPYCLDNDHNGVYLAIIVNANFPHEMAVSLKEINPQSKIIQIATDCVYSGSIGKYHEESKHDALDVYGKTKSLGEVHLENFINIRTSIIGPEINAKLSLLEWFLSNHFGCEVKGFDHHEWNGCTTLQFAKLCEKMIIENEFEKLRKISHTLHYVINESVSKYRLLEIFNEVFDKKCVIKKVDYIGEPINRSLSTKLWVQEVIPMKQAISELKQFIIKSSLFS